MPNKAHPRVAELVLFKLTDFRFQSNNKDNTPEQRMHFKEKVTETEAELTKLGIKF